MKRIPALATAILAFALSSTGMALLLTPTPAPVDRIVQNTEAQLAKHPRDLELRYQLARVHYLAYALKKSELGIYPHAGRGPETAKDVAGEDNQDRSRNKKVSLNAGEAMAHAERSAELFNQVLEKNPKHTLANLGRGSLLEQFSKESTKAQRKASELLAKCDGVTIRKHYEVAFEQAWKKLRDAKSLASQFDDRFVGREAAQGYLRSAKADKKKLTDKEKENVTRMTDALTKIPTLPIVALVTPLIFSSKAVSSIDSLLAPEVAVDFDLRGFGVKERWPWLRAETGVLVWDPAGEGKITSSRQMFGSYSWQLFWRDGFEALAALDDDQDGWLRGAELEGIGVWFDRNQNAVSDAGEVKTLAELEVTGLACSTPEMEGRHPVNRMGVEFRNGQRVPLWDWMTEPLAPLRQEVARK